jgi:predicted AAA+ superfamily ATPase
MKGELFYEYLEKIEERIKKEQIIKRDLNIQLKKRFPIAIVGPRRSGKTYLMFNLYKQRMDNSLYIDFEHPIFTNISYENILEIINYAEEYKNSKIEFLFLDEVQELNNWPKIIRSLIDFGYNVIISGSSSKLMSKEIATQLRGRVIEKLLLPLDFTEFLRFRNIEIPQKISISNKNKIINMLKKYLEIGGFPKVVLNEKDKDDILKNYFITILYKDFIERFELKHIHIARFILEFCLQNYSNEISVRNIVNYINSLTGKNMKNIIYDYVDKLPETLIVFFVRKFSKSIYERESWPKKVYICDLGLANTIRFEKDFGKRMENIIFLKLLRKINENPLIEIFYFKANYEVDFLIKEDSRITKLIQVTYASGFDEIDRREIRGLLYAKEIFKLHKPELIIITWDYEDEKNLFWFNKKGKIKFIPMWKWMLLN